MARGVTGLDSACAWRRQSSFSGTGAFDAWRCGKLRRRPGRFSGALDPDPLNPPRVGINDFDIESGRVPQNFATLRQAARQRDSKARHGVEFILVLRERQPDAQHLLEFFNVRAAIGFKSAGGPFGLPAVV